MKGMVIVRVSETLWCVLMDGVCETVEIRLEVQSNTRW